MFQVLAAVCVHLQAVPHFQTWDVRDGLSLTPRSTYPAVDLRIGGAAVGSTGTANVTLEPSISVRLISERGPSVPADLDTAFSAAIKALHGLQLKDTTGRPWSWLKLVGVRDLPVVDGYVGCEMVFTTSSEFNGQQCDC